MKGNNRIWYIGYSLSLLLIVVMFCNDFSKIAKVMLVTDIEGIPKIYSFSISELNQMSKIINSIGYRKSED